MKRVAVLSAASLTLIVVAIALLANPGAKMGDVGQKYNTSDTWTATPQFVKAVNLSNNTQDSVYGQVAAAGHTVYVVWQESMPVELLPTEQYATQNYDIFMLKSDDGGLTFNPPVNLSDSPGFSEHPQVAAAGDRLYAVWADNTVGNKEVIFATSDDRGRGFEAEINLSGTPEDSYNQEIAAYGDSVHVVWLEEANERGRILLRSSADGGRTFGDAAVISENAGLSTLPKVAADSRGVHVAWSRLEGNDKGLYYSASRVGGGEFGLPTRLADGSEFGEAQIVTANNTVYVVAGGQDSLAVEGLLLAKSTNGGTSFSSEIIDVNGTYVNPLNVEAAVSDDSKLYVAGQVLVAEDEEILLLPLEIRANATGIIGVTNLSNNERISECPSIAISGDVAFVVWEDLSPGNHEILYARVNGI